MISAGQLMDFLIELVYPFFHSENQNCYCNSTLNSLFRILPFFRGKRLGTYCYQRKETKAQKMVSHDHLGDDLASVEKQTEEIVAQSVSFYFLCA